MRGLLAFMLLAGCAGPPPSATTTPARERGALHAGVGLYAEELRAFRVRAGSGTTRRHLERLEELYDRQLRTAQEALAVARRREIAALESSVEGEGSPEDMLRLAWLNYEDSYDRYLEYVEGEGEEEVRDFTPSIEVLRRLVTEFPRFSQSDRARYLLGHCLHLQGLVEEAALAWLSLVCASTFQYREGDDDVDAAFLYHGLDAEEPAPYEGCAPAETPFLDVSWLRIGEYHLHYDYSSLGLERAASAYRHACRNRGSELYDEALFRLARTHYRAGRYAEAARRFAELVTYSDERAATGRPDSELRDEAIRWLMICFTDCDWNNDYLRDDVFPVERLRGSELLPPDQPYTAEVLIETGNGFMNMTMYNDAIEVFELILERWPLIGEAPELVRSIVESQTRNREFEKAIQRHEGLWQYTPGSPWAKANPARALEGRAWIREELYLGALGQHDMAASLREIAKREDSVEILGRAVDQYGQAARAYKRYLHIYPGAPNRYEATFNLAGASYYACHYSDASQGFAWIRSSVLDGRLRDAAARSHVKSVEAEAQDEEPLPAPRSTEDQGSDRQAPSKSGPGKRRKGRGKIIVLDEACDGCWAEHSGPQPLYSFELVAAKSTHLTLRPPSRIGERPLPHPADQDVVVPLGKATAEVSLVRRALLQARGSMGRCSQEAKLREPTTGQAAIHISLSDHVRASAHPVGGSRETALGRCLATLIEGLEFPSPSSGDYLFLFDPALVEDLEPFQAPAGAENPLPGALRLSRRERPEERSGWGVLDRNEVWRVIARALGKLSACHVRRARQTPQLSGTLNLELVIGVGGRVIDARARDSSLPQGVEHCIVERAGRLKFPSPEGGNVRVSHPLVFRPISW